MIIDYFLTTAQVVQHAGTKLQNFNKNNTLKNINEKFNFNLVTPEIIFVIINSIKTDAVGNLGISASMLKICFPYNIPLITNII